MKKLLTLCLLIAASAHAATQKQSLVSTIQSVKTPLWLSTTTPTTSDPALLLSPILATLPGLPATSTLFFSRTPVVMHVDELLDTNASLFDRYRSHLQAITVQEHTLGMQLGQQWQQENWELSWQWWLGVRERNVWLKQSHRKQLRELLEETPFAPRTLNPWHATALHAGIGDVHITARYRLPIGNFLIASLGVHTVLPTATKQSVRNEQKESNLSLETDTLVRQLTKRTRDILLHSPFGINGHTGMGLSAGVALHLGPYLRVIGEATSIRFRANTQRRYGLKQSIDVPFLTEGDADTQAGMSSDNDVRAYLEQYVYPQEHEVKLDPGALHAGSIQLAYTSSDIHCAIGYRHEIHEDEIADDASSMMIRTESTAQQQLTMTTSVSNHHGWGTTSSYITGHYTVAGTHTGSWSVGVGLTVQA